MSAWLIHVQRSFGMILLRSRSAFTGSVCFVQPRRRARRPTWVSTTTPSGAFQTFPRTTFAVFRPTPGSAWSSTIVCGTSPPCFSTSAFAIPRRDFAFALKKPVERIIFSSAPGGEAARAATSGKRRKTSGVTMFTRVSVHCAERIVATRSSSGLWKSSEHAASPYRCSSRFSVRSTGAAFRTSRSAISGPEHNRGEPPVKHANSCVARTTVLRLAPRETRPVTRARPRSSACMRLALVFLVRPRRGRSRRRDDPRNDGSPRSPCPVGLPARPARRRRPRARRLARRRDPPGDAERAPPRRGRHDPGHADRVPPREGLVEGPRPDGRGDERPQVRRDVRREPRLQLRARGPPQGPEGVLVPVALLEHAERFGRLGRVPGVPRQDGRRDPDRNPRPHDAEHPELGAGAQPSGPPVGGPRGRGEAPRARPAR